jgi:hypothetical protein
MNRDICPLSYDFHAAAAIRMWCLKRIEDQVGHAVEVCGEPSLGRSTPCVSDLDTKLLDVAPILDNYHVRPACYCLANKFELLKPEKIGPCLHGCVYCYLK